ncbi:MAG: hypothetical protein JST92_27360 [Deltaproteobacteria bacterium]|nr:hypothetical protein [Deltaproteobacteria bacterium]
MPELLHMRTAGRFDSAEQLHTPVLEGDFIGLKLAADEVWLEDGVMTFRALVAYQLPNDLAQSYRDLAGAMVLVVRAGTDAGMVHLMDPSVNRINTDDDNFTDKRGGRRCNVMASGQFAAPIEVKVGAERALLAHVALHGHVSNIVRVDPAAVKLP